MLSQIAANDNIILKSNLCCKSTMSLLYLIAWGCVVQHIIKQLTSICGFQRYMMWVDDLLKTYQSRSIL